MTVIEHALDQAYPDVASELRELSMQGKGMSGRATCRRLLERLVSYGWTITPPEGS